MSALQSQIGYVTSSAVDVTSLKVSICPTWTDLEQFRAGWNLLLESCPGASIFQTPEWTSAWWHAYGSKKELVGLIFYDSRSRVVAIAPLYRERTRSFGLPVSVLRLVGAGSGDSDALDFIVAPGYEQACAESFVQWLAGESHADFCALETLPQSSVFAQCLNRSVQQHGGRLYSETSPNFVIDLPSAWPQYLETLESSFRPLLTRYPKRLQSRHRVSIARCERATELDASLETLFALHQMRWTGQGEPGAFASPERRDFYLRMSRAFLERGWLQFWLLTLEDEAVAAQFCFRYGNTVSLLQEGFHPKYAAEKVGYALRAHVLQQMIESGANRYDFLGGADNYKARFGARENSYVTLRFAPRSWRGRLHLAVRHGALQTKQWLKKNLPAPLLAAIRHEKSPASAAGQKTEGRE
jgi:CelD/BcsL family acetyltransferase involved in cellulose biosynthesis